MQYRNGDDTKMHELIMTAALWICALLGKWIVYRLSPEEECFQIYAIAMPLVLTGANLYDAFPNTSEIGAAIAFGIACVATMSGVLLMKDRSGNRIYYSILLVLICVLTVYPLYPMVRHIC